MKAIRLAQGEYLYYTDNSAVIASDYRKTDKVGIHLVEERPLDTDEIEEFLQQDHEIEDRELSDKEQDIIDSVYLYYPQVKLKVEAIKALSQEAKEKYKEQRRQERIEKKEREKQYEEFVKEKAPEKPKGGKRFVDWLVRFALNQTPEEQRKSKELKDTLRKNYRRMQKLAELVGKQKGLINKLDEAVRKGNVNVEDLVKFNHLLSQDPNWMSGLTLPTAKKISKRKYRGLETQLQEPYPVLTLPISRIPGVSSDESETDSETLAGDIQVMMSERGIRNKDIVDIGVEEGSGPSREAIIVSPNIGSAWRIADQLGLRYSDLIKRD